MPARCFLPSAVLALSLVSCQSGGKEPAQPTSSSAFALTRVVRIPTVLVDEPGSESAPGNVAVTAGAEDELPQGPQGFDVLPDDSFVITDPLRTRLAFFSQQGEFSRALDLGFAADSVLLNANSQLRVRRASTGDHYLVDETGRVSPLPSSPQRSADEAGEAQLIGPNRGVVKRPAGRGIIGGDIEISHEDRGTRMVSLQNLGMDEAGYTYVAVETTAGGMAIDVTKAVRKYTPDGALEGEISEIPIDYYVVPVDEFRIHRQTVYHLVPGPGGLKIYIWDTSRRK